MTHYSKYFTSHDLLKLVAICSMIIDHIGLFFFPQYVMFRIIGRLAFPIFAFLIGYSLKYNKINIILYCVLCQMIFHYLVYNDSINFAILYNQFLISIILIRVFMLYMVKYFEAHLNIICIVLCITIPISIFLFHYGNFGMLFAICGYNCKYNYKYIKNNTILLFFILYCFYSCIIINQLYELILLIIELYFLYFVLLRYKLLYYNIENIILKNLLITISRNSLFVYITHYESFYFISYFIVCR